MHTGLWFPTYSSTPLMTRSEGPTQGYTTAPMNTFTSFHTLCIITHRVYHILTTHIPQLSLRHTLSQVPNVTLSVIMSPSHSHIQCRGHSDTQPHPHSQVTHDHTLSSHNHTNPQPHMVLRSQSRIHTSQSPLPGASFALQ